MSFTFESFLQNKFIDKREWGGIPIIKDNCEDLFDGWLGNLDGEEYMEYAEQAIQLARLEGKEEMFKQLEPHIETLKTEAKKLGLI